jgi:RNA polymerase sigma-70 factor (ECF subfamily)
MQVGLVERAQLGDRAAFDSLVAASLDRSYAIAFRILRDAGRAQDATQQAYLAAWRDLPGLREPGRFEAWLRRLVVRACYAEADRERRWAAGVRLIPADTATVPDTATALADAGELERAFRRLKPDERAVLVLHHYLGIPLTEIAETLDIPAGTARSRLHTASRRLRASIEADARPANPKEQTA